MLCSWSRNECCWWLLFTSNLMQMVSKLNLSFEQRVKGQKNRQREKIERTSTNTRVKIRHCCYRFAWAPPLWHGCLGDSEGGCNKPVWQVEALQVQMEEKTRLAQEQIEMLMEDRRLKTEEAEVQRNRYQKQIRALTDRWVTLNMVLLGHF